MEETAQDRLLQKIEALLISGKMPDASSASARIVAAAQSNPEKAIAVTNGLLLGKPLAYLLGRQRFMGVALLVRPGRSCRGKRPNCSGRLRSACSASNLTPRN